MGNPKSIVPSPNEMFLRFYGPWALGCNFQIAIKRIDYG